MRVFIVEDSPLVQERLRAMVSDLEHADLIGDARDFTEALDLITELNPDMVILDLRLPGGNGLEILKNIKQRPDAPLVTVLTNHADPIYREHCLKAGADFFFDKSTEFERAIEVIRSLTQQRKNAEQ